MTTDHTLLRARLVLDELIQHPVKLLDVEWQCEGGKWFLRVYVYKEDGTLSVEDCAAIHRPLLDALLKHELADCTLEVSSPGAFRELKTPADWMYARGKRVKVYGPEIAGAGHVAGDLKHVDETTIRLAGQDIPRCQITKAHLDPHLDFTKEPCL